MPEIYVCFYGLFQLTRCFTNNCSNIDKEIANYENKTQCDMAEIRMKLFTDFGYC